MSPRRSNDPDVAVESIQWGDAVRVVGLYNYALAAGFFIAPVQPAKSYVLFAIIGTGVWFLGTILQ